MIIPVLSSTMTQRTAVESSIMYGRHLLATFAILLVAAGSVRAQEAGLKIGFINSQLVLENDPQFIEAQEQFNQELEVIRQEVEAKEMALDSLIRGFEQQQLSMSPATRQERQAAIATTQGEYQQQVTQLQQQAERRQQEIVQPVMERINQVIEELRVEGQYTIILDIASGAILAADQGLDLTQELIRRLQS
jgi:outer membrane protein